MELWMSAVVIVLLALVLDVVIGEVPNSIHPLRWMGNILDRLDSAIKRGKRVPTAVKGFLSYLLVFLLFSFIAFTVTALSRHFLSGFTFMEISIGEIVWIIISAILFKLTFAVFSFRRHCKPIQNDLDKGDTVSAAAKTQMIVSRNTEGMNAEHVSSSCCESISENYVDSVCSPMLYFGLFGLIGAIMFRCANLMDAMWGYLDDKYGDLGFFPAKFDDILGFVTSRISILFIAFASIFVGGCPKSAMRCAFAEHRKTPSPNSGWPMTAAAGALGFRMEKKDVYVMCSGPMPSVKDISRMYKLIELASVIFLLVVTLPLFVFVGIHVQLFIENSLLMLFGVL